MTKYNFLELLNNEGLGAIRLMADYSRRSYNSLYANIYSIKKGTPMRRTTRQALLDVYNKTFGQSLNMEDVEWSNS